MPTTSSPTQESFLVCVGPSPSSADLIRAVQKMAADAKADWFAVYVETPKMLRLAAAERNRAVYHLRLAEQLGAETVTLRGSRVARRLVGTRGTETVLQVAVRQFAAIFQCKVVALLPDDAKRLHPVAGDMDALFCEHILKEMSVAQWAYEKGQIAGWGTQDAQGADNLYVPLQAAEIFGVLALRPADPQSPQWSLPEQLRLRLLESLAKEVALALGVERLQEETDLDARRTPQGLGSGDRAT